MNQKIKQQLQAIFTIKFNRNQWRQLQRLIYEVQKREKIDINSIITKIESYGELQHLSPSDKFNKIRKILIKLRYPLSSQRRQIQDNELFLPKIQTPVARNHQQPLSIFKPEKIFIEQAAVKSKLTQKIKNKFPRVKTEILNRSADYIKKHKFDIRQLKNPYLFIVNQKWDFIKPCPCTQNHLGCNYWIFNASFGCPFDCTYCFLQQYANFPGIIIPANLDDFFTDFNKFYAKIKRPIRIGTGEFCDSLALDHITNYSTKLINFFSNKNLLFELKTKSDQIQNILNAKPAPNIIISWSLNPQTIIDNNEFGTASLKRRLAAANQVREKGFSLSFHFDPIIYSNNWQELYHQTIKTLYQELEPGFSWISLGTLRGSPKLKTIAEARFPENQIFYGELLAGKDRKLRYPHFLRQEIYAKMIHWIRQFDSKTPVYLCMEDKESWQVMDKKLTTTADVEGYLLQKNSHRL